MSPGFAAAGAQEFWRRKFLGPFLALLDREVRPETLALGIALGAVLGVCPLIGVPTVLCFAAALALRLNAAILQAVNYLVYPLQLILIVPFFRLGAHLFRPETGTFSAAAIGSMALHAAAAWLCVCVPAGLMLYFGLVEVLRRWAAGRRTG